MHAKALISLLAEKWGISTDRAMLIDRSLVESGLRAKGRGRNLPDMTRYEAIQFLLACMATHKPTRAGEAAQALSQYKTLHFRESAENLAEQTRLSKQSSLKDGADIYAYVSRTLLPLLEPLATDDPGSDSQTIELANYLLAICSVLEWGRLDPNSMTFDVISSNPSAKLTIFDGWGNPVFSAIFVAPELNADRTSFREITSVFGSVLSDIASHTVDPLTDNKQ